MIISGSFQIIVTIFRHVTSFMLPKSSILFYHYTTGGILFRQPEQDILGSLFSYHPRWQESPASSEARYLYVKYYRTTTAFWSCIIVLGSMKSYYCFILYTLLIGDSLRFYWYNMT